MEDVFNDAEGIITGRYNVKTIRYANDNAVQK